MLRIIQIFLLVFLFSESSFAKIGQWKDSVQNIDAGKVRLINSINEDDDGKKSVIVGLHFKLKSGWKLYSKDAGGVGLPPKLKFSAKNYESHEILWPSAIKVEEKIGDTVLKYSVYKNEVILPVLVDFSKINESDEVKLAVEYGVCKDICIPASNEFKFKISDFDAISYELIAQYLPDHDDEHKNLPQDSKMGVLTLCSGIFLAFLGGLILNIMPCVLPVLGVKLISILNHKNAPIEKVRISFVGSALGILSSFILFGFFAIALAKAGEVFNWGIQFQNPYFIISLILILLFFAANMLGFFEISFSNFLANMLNKKITKTEKKNIFIPNFLSGILAVLLATPCSAPFLGAAISFSITQPSLVIFAIFLAMGVGFALPYILLIFWPKAVYLLPKSGSWTMTVKKIMAGFLIVTILWLIYVISGISGLQVAFSLLIISILILAAFLIKFKFIKYIAILSLILSAICLPMKIEDGFVNPKHKMDRVWLEFQEDQIQPLVDSGKVVIVDVTANWCLTCKFNKYRVLRSKSVVRRLRQNDVVAMRADITKPNQEIMNFINSHNRFAIPFNVVYGPNAEHGILASEILTKDEILDLIKEAKGE